MENEGQPGQNANNSLLAKKDRCPLTCKVRKAREAPTEGNQIQILDTSFFRGIEQVVC